MRLPWTKAMIALFELFAKVERALRQLSITSSRSESFSPNNVAGLSSTLAISTGLGTLTKQVFYY
jgi:hypothetical protein